MYVCLCVIYVSVCLYVYTCISMCVCMCVCARMYIHVLCCDEKTAIPSCCLGILQYDNPTHTQSLDTETGA